MSWMVTAVAGSALLGAYNSNRQAATQANQQKQQMLAQAAQTQYSPWTGASIQTRGSNAPDAQASTINGALQGGLTGAMMASQFKSPSASTPPPSLPNGATVTPPNGQTGQTINMNASGSPWTAKQTLFADPNQTNYRTIG